MAETDTTITTQSKTKVNLLSILKTQYRQLTLLPYYDPRYSHHFPYFGYGIIDLMLRDARITYALNLIKGPIYNYTKFFSQEEADDPAIQQAIIDLDYHFSYEISSDNAETEEYVLRNLNRFWNNGALKALKAIEWGYSPNQVLYRRNTSSGMIEYDNLINYSVYNVKPVTRGNDLAGIFFKRQHKFLAFPKSFIHLHGREFNSFVGRSRFWGCHVPWHETWVLGGARDVRRNWFFRCSYDGGTLYVPQEQVVDENGNTVDATEVGTKILENSFTGSYRVFPKKEYEKGKQDRAWDYEPPKTNTTPQGLQEYLSELRIEILEGLGIPPETVESANSNGLGSATGRKIPLLAFYATLSPLSIDLIEDVRRQIIDPGLRANGMSEEYEIKRIIPKAYEPVGAAQDQIAATETNTDPATPNPDRQ